METIVTSRIEADLKNRVVCILRDRGLTASDAIRQMFEQVAMSNDVQFLATKKADVVDMRHKIAHLDSIYVHGFEDMSDGDLKRMRREERYAAVPRH